MLMTSRPTTTIFTNDRENVARRTDTHTLSWNKYISEALSLLPRVTRQITKIYFNTSLDRETSHTGEMRRVHTKRENKYEIWMHIQCRMTQYYADDGAIEFGLTSLACVIFN